MKKKKIASNVNDIIFSEIDLKENTLNNNDDVVYYSLDVMSDNSSNNSDKSLNLDEYDLNIEDFEIKNISINDSYNSNNIEDNKSNSVDNTVNMEDDTDNLIEELNSMSNKKHKEYKIEVKETDPSKIKLNTSEFFKILNQHKSTENTDNSIKNKMDIDNVVVHNTNTFAHENNIADVVVGDNIVDVEQDNIANVEQDNIADVEQEDNIVDVEQEDNIADVEQEDNIADVEQEDNIVDVEQEDNIVDVDNVTVDNVVVEDNIADVDNITVDNVVVEDNVDINKLKNIETNEKLEIWKDLVDNNLYSSYNYLQTETQTNNLVNLINKTMLFKFYKLAENHNKNIYGYIDNNKILNCSQGTTYKYEVHTKLSNMYIDPPGNYINILINKDLDIVKCIFLLNNNGYWTIEPLENFILFKNDANKQKILLAYFIILKILFCNKYYPFNEGNTIQKYRNLTKNINLNIINHVNKNNKFKSYINNQLKTVYNQELMIEDLIDIINNNNINKYYGRILKLKYKYY